MLYEISGVDYNDNGVLSKPLLAPLLGAYVRDCPENGLPISMIVQYIPHHPHSYFESGPTI